MLILNRKGRAVPQLLAICSQFGDTNPPNFDSFDTDFAGAAPTWARNSAGNYTLTFPAGTFIEDPGPLTFVQITGTSAAMIVHVVYSHADEFVFIFRDATGAIIEADCTFSILIFAVPDRLPV